MVAIPAKQALLATLLLSFMLSGCSAASGQTGGKFPIPSDAFRCGMDGAPLVGYVTAWGKFAQADWDEASEYVVELQLGRSGHSNPAYCADVNITLVRHVTGASGREIVKQWSQHIEKRAAGGSNQQISVDDSDMEPGFHYGLELDVYLGAGRHEAPSSIGWDYPCAKNCVS